MKSTMQSRVRAYLARRRALGFRLLIEGRMLLGFARYADRTGHRGPLTQELAIRWATLARDADPLYRARRLEVVRVFAKHQRAYEPATQLLPRHVLGPAHRRPIPHIYPPAQIDDLLDRAHQLCGSLRPHTYYTLIGLLVCTGLRISEALSMEISDVDLARGVLTVRESKFRHSRLLPLHPSAIQALLRYARRRHRLFAHARHFFVSESGLRLPYSTVRTTFRRISKHILSTAPRRRVRLHDLRHTFTCRVLLQWQRSRRGAAGRIAVLTRYLGHQHATDTYWYLSALPELLAEAARRVEPLV